MIENSLPKAIIAPDITTRKMMHPKVLRVLTQLRVPSPVNIPRDESQPITGDLKRRNKLSSFLPPVERNIVNPKQITLALNSNALMRKRGIIK